MSKTKWHKFPDEKPDENRPCFVTMQCPGGGSYVSEQYYRYDKTGDFWINLNAYISSDFISIVAWTYADEILPDPYAMEDQHKDDFININIPSKSGIYICKTRQGTIGAYKYIKKCYRWYDIDDECNAIDVTDDVIAYKEIET